MAGKLTGLLAGCALALAISAGAHAQAPAEPQSESSDQTSKRRGGYGGGPDGRRPGGGRPDSERFEHVRKSIDALTPDQRRRFQENLQRWGNMSPEEKKALADRDAFRRKKIAEDIEAAIKEVGLNLSEQERELFAKRYAEERRSIEEQLRREMDEKREPLLKNVVAKLKAEFSASATAADTTAKQPDTAIPAVPSKP